MKYTNEVTINLPRERVIELFDNPDNLKHWQEGYVSFEHLSGEQGKPGAKSRLYYKMGKRNVELTETIIERSLPETYHATYEAKGILNIQKNFFTSVDENTTRWDSQTECQLNGIMMKIMGFLMPGMFRKQSQKYLDAFKKFAEAQ